jgi:phosphoglycolate phosphatase-like HAD superfamily hydrolase
MPAKQFIPPPPGPKAEETAQRLYEHFSQLLRGAAEGIADQVVALYQEAQAEAQKFRKAGTKIILVDFDGVIRDGLHPDDPAVVDDGPVPGAFDFLQDLLSAGWKTVVFTSRMSDEGGELETIEAALRDWFLQHDFPPKALDQLEFSAVTIPAQVYLDDRGI